MKPAPRVVFHTVTRSQVKKFFITEGLCGPAVFAVLDKAYANEFMAALGSMASSPVIHKGYRFFQSRFRRKEHSISLQRFLSGK
ncbi:hypothetical protein V1498_07530 [Peribacillus sp. SCS-26]|uniref:hypothetical protein n=1 Tax=Paraperibacillus marinus TaxID=3115295 RepID=UPI003906D3AA